METNEENTMLRLPSARRATILLGAMLLVPYLTHAQNPEAFVGTFHGQHWTGPFTLQVEREGDAYRMVFAAHGSTAAPVRMTVDEAGDLFGTLGRERYWIRRDGAGFRFRARGYDVPVEKHAISDGTALATQWVRDLGGVRLVQMSSSYDSSSGSSTRTEIHLCPDGRFRLDYRSSFRASTGGVSASSRNSDSDTGLWRVLTHNGLPVLELRPTRGEVLYAVPNVRGDQFFLGDERTFVERDAACS
jgi:hypothetical protein